MKYIKTFENFSLSNFDFEIPTEEFIIKILNTFNIKYSSIDFLAEGGYGFVVDLGNDTVLKITIDNIEAYYAEKLLSIDSPHLIKIHQVVEIKSKYQYGKLYAIHQEKVITEFNNRIKHMIDYLHKPNPIIGRLLNNTLNDSIILDFFKDKFIGWSDELIIQCFNIIKVLYLECQKYNLPYAEIHSKNVGFRINTKDIVYFDVSSPYEFNNDKIFNIPIIEVK